MPACSVVNALSFDIEEWFHLLDMPAVADRRQWAKFPALAERYTHRILRILGDADVRATFFMVGWVARRYPKLARTIVDHGHEVASHSYWHQSIHELSEEQFRKDLTQSVDVIEQQTGRKVLGFRAPGFTLNGQMNWAFDVMLDLGLKYDASLMPVRHTDHGAGLRHPHCITDTPSGRPIMELPASVLRLGPLSTRYCGGGYLRMMPSVLLKQCIAWQNHRGLPVVVYMHPRDIAPDCPRIAMPAHRRFRCYVGLRTAERKLGMLLRHFRFDACAAVLGLSLPQPRVLCETTREPQPVQVLHLQRAEVA
jgi:polysaccharide deacetylase family protein (PEP-CTERM system associated)